jgi:alkanesulfonate monooxygenase SsuD/methylene tetrahydromethanopterin reductase-like flavin-dependent oxidoreductase (luciferase family)
MAERFARYESAVATLAALFSDAARRPPGVNRDDPYYPLLEATLEPAPTRPQGPQVWLGGQRRRGIALAARYAEGWPMPGNEAGNVPYFAAKRDEIRRALDEAGRDPDAFIFGAQLTVSRDAGSLGEGRATALEFLRAGANHFIIGVPGGDGPDALRAMAREVAQPLRDAAA